MTSVSNMEFHESHSLFTLYHVMACYQCLKFRVGCLNTFAYALAVLIYGEPSLKAAGLSGFVPLQAHMYRLHVVRRENELP